MSIQPNAKNLARQMLPQPRPRRPRRRTTGAAPDVLLLVRARANGRCERCAACVPADAEVHHRRPRGMGGTRQEWVNRPPNLAVLCRSCHRHVESRRDRARFDGWLVPTGQHAADVPVASRLHGWVLLIDDGTVAPVGGAA